MRSVGFDLMSLRADAREHLAHPGDSLAKALFFAVIFVAYGVVGFLEGIAAFVGSFYLATSGHVLGAVLASAFGVLLCIIGAWFTQQTLLISMGPIRIARRCRAHT